MSKTPHEWRGWHLVVHENRDQPRGVVITACHIEDGLIVFHTKLGKFTFYDHEVRMPDDSYKFEGDFGRYAILKRGDGVG